MKRSGFSLGTLLSLAGLACVLLCTQGVADEKNRKAAGQDVKFACSQHGPKDMQLTLKLGTGTSSRAIIFTGGTDTTKWLVQIDGSDVSVDNGKTVEVHSGDSITWKVADKKHGVAFAEKALAEAMLQFDTTVGKPLIDQNMKLTSNDWKMFGNDRWGTDPTSDKVVLASCKVK
jgi:plastocyanin